MPLDEQGRRYLQIGPARFYVASGSEGNDAAFIICGPTSFFVDDERGACAACDTPIVFRPHTPSRPPKLCAACALAFIQATEQ